MASGWEREGEGDGGRQRGKQREKKRGREKGQPPHSGEGVLVWWEGGKHRRRINDACGKQAICIQRCPSQIPTQLSFLTNGALPFSLSQTLSNYGCLCLKSHSSAYFRTKDCWIMLRVFLLEILLYFLLWCVHPIMRNWSTFFCVFSVQKGERAVWPGSIWKALLSWKLRDGGSLRVANFLEFKDFSDSNSPSQWRSLHVGNLINTQQNKMQLYKVFICLFNVGNWTLFRYEIQQKCYISLCSGILYRWLKAPQENETNSTTIKAEHF